jgi:hypothetical protein
MWCPEPFWFRAVQGFTRNDNINKITCSCHCEESRFGGATRLRAEALRRATAAISILNLCHITHLKSNLGETEIDPKK